MTSTRPHEALPTREDASGLCPNPACGKYVQFERPHLLDSVQQEQTIWPQLHARMDEGHDLRIDLGLWLCPACQQNCVVFLRHQKVRFVDEDGKSSWRTARVPTLAWPARRPRELEEGVPEKIRDLFAEGSVTEHAGALRAAAALYRATVEEICAERGAQGRNLKQKIEDLKNRGVSEGTVDDLHEVRMTGNWSLHEGEPFAADEVADVADLIVEATVELYVQPAERARMREARRARRNGSGA
ncbi:DUF4145 domain-containing protein [Nocardiopsis sp. NPDC006938]|uniref:DUF4145 domain-containing protein n=1 Tax=Nocardiopsis sp. NPDC006938 TaxID=3364337 RepID=UPI0036B53F51